MAYPATGLVQVFNYDDQATYAVGIAAGIITGGTAPGIKNDDAFIAGIGGLGIARAGAQRVDGPTIDIVVTNDSKSFLLLGVPASATAGFNAFSFLAGDGTNEWQCDNGIIHSVELKWELHQALTASVGMDALKSVRAASAAAQATLTRNEPFMMALGSIQYAAANYIVQSATVKCESKYEPYYDFNTGKSTPKRIPSGFVRTGLQVTGEIECLSRIDSNVEDDAPVPGGSLVLTGSDNATIPNTITITATLTAGITTGGDAWSYTPDGIQTFKYAFIAPPNTVALAIT